MNISTPETIKVANVTSSDAGHFRIVVEKINFNDPKPLLQFKAQLA